MKRIYMNDIELKGDKNYIDDSVTVFSLKFFERILEGVKLYFNAIILTY